MSKELELIAIFTVIGITVIAIEEINQQEGLLGKKIN